jgi:hypothetical protein
LNLLRGWRRLLWGGAITIVLLLVATGVVIIYFDRPQQPAQISYVGVAFSCPLGSSLVLHTTPNLSINVNPDSESYQVIFTIWAETDGPAPCRIVMDLPSDAQEIPYLYDTASGTALTIPMVEHQTNQGRYVEGMAPLARGDASETLLMQNSFTTRAGLRSNGWGRHDLFFNFGNGFAPVAGIRLGEGAFPVRDDSRTEEDLQLEFEVPPGHDITQTFPSGTISKRFGAVSWPHTGAELPQVYMATYQIDGIRFWVSHATDLLTISIGALLGLLLALRKPDNTAQTASSPPNNLPYPISHSGHSMRYWYFLSGAVALLSWIWIRNRRARIRHYNQCRYGSRCPFQRF